LVLPPLLLVLPLLVLVVVDLVPTELDFGLLVAGFTVPVFLESPLLPDGLDLIAGLELLLPLFCFRCTFGC